MPGKRMRVASLCLAIGFGWGAPTAWAQCEADATVFVSGFDSAPASRVAGDVVGLHKGEVELWTKGGSVPVAVTELDPGIGYELEVPELPADAMLSLRVRGVGHERFVELAADIGSAAKVSRASSDPIRPTGLQELPALAVTSETTVRHALLSADDATAAAPATDCQLALAEQALDPEQVLDARALLSLVIEQGAIHEAAGQTVVTTLDLLRSRAAREAEWTHLSNEVPDRVQAMSTRLREPLCPAFQDSVRIGQRGRGLLVNDPQAHAELYEFINATQGVATMYSESGFTFECADGVATFRFDDGFPSEVLVQSPVPGESGQIRMVSRFEALSYRVADVSQHETVLWRSSLIRSNFPERPELGTSTRSDLSVRSALVTVRTLGLLADLEDGPQTYSLPVGPLQWHGFEPELVELRGDGSGRRIADDAAASWQVNAIGALVLSVGGDDFELLSIGSEPGAERVFVRRFGQAHAPAVKVGRVVQREVDAGWSLADVPATLTLVEVLGHADSSSVPLVLAAEGITLPAGNFSFGWVIDAQQRLLMRRCRSPAGPLFSDPAPIDCRNYDRRVLEVLRRDGDSWHVIDHQQSFHSSNLGPHTPSVGDRRLRSYRYSPGTP